MELTKKRLSWIDIAKAITIILVVFGHTMRGGTIQRIIYSFHVTTFFVLSGMTCKCDKAISRIKKDFVNIMIPYYCFGIISILVFVVLGRFAAGQLNLDVNTSFSSNFIELLVACPKNNRMKYNMPLWFLPCLFVTKILYYSLHSLFKGKQQYIVAVSGAIAVLSFIYTRTIGISLPFNLSVASKMIFFLSLGKPILTSINVIIKKIPDKKVHLLISAILFAVTASIAIVTPKVNYSGDTFPNIPAFIITSLLGSLGICFIATGIGSCKAFEYLGKRTLAVLAMHKFPVLLFQTVGPFKNLLMQYDTIMCIISVTVITVVAVLLCIVAEYIIRRIFPFLLGDFSSFSNIIKNKV